MIDSFPALVFSWTVRIKLNNVAEIDMDFDEIHPNKYQILVYDWDMKNASQRMKKKHVLRFYGIEISHHTDYNAWIVLFVLD